MADIIGKLKGKLDEGLARAEKSLSRASVKSKKLIGKQKIRLHLSELNAERKIAYQNLGKIAYTIVQSSGGGGIIDNGKKVKSSKPMSAVKDKWDESVLTVLKNVHLGSLGGMLFEETATEIKITAKKLVDEVEKLLPDSEKKGQNLQWLGRVLGKFDLPKDKYSKRIDGERQTVYVFDRKKIEALGNDASNAEESIHVETSDMSDILTACAEITRLDEKIAALEKDLKNA